MKSPLDQAVDLMREAQRLVDGEHPIIAAHLETVVGLAVDRSVARGVSRGITGSATAR